MIGPHTEMEGTGLQVFKYQKAATSAVGIFSNVRTGAQLTLASLTALRSHPELLLYPLIGGLATVVIGVVPAVGVLVGEIVGGTVAYVTLFVLYAVTTFVSSYFTAALVYAVNERFHDRTASISTALRAAWQKRRLLFLWSVVAAVVGVIIRSLEQSDSPLSKLAGAAFSVGWSVTTFFMLPVIVLENTSGTRMFKTSARTFTKTWGETLGAGLGIGMIQTVFVVIGMLPIGAISVGIWMTRPTTGIVVFGAGTLGVMLASLLVGQTVRGITKTALYHYATETEVPPGFEGFDFETLEGRTETPS